jgi:hypothetical protein
VPGVPSIECEWRFDGVVDGGVKETTTARRMLLAFLVGTMSFAALSHESTMTVDLSDAAPFVMDLVVALWTLVIGSVVVLFWSAFQKTRDQPFWSENISAFWTIIIYTFDIHLTVISIFDIVYFRLNILGQSPF